MLYSVRPATLADLDALVRHRVQMFTDMGVPLDAVSLERAFRAWLLGMMPANVYRAWVVDAVPESPAEAGHEGRHIVGGGGITILPWPPGPRYMGDRLAFVYNVYTEPQHRRRGLARLVMDVIHAWCREAGIASIGLTASPDGRPLYEHMGYQVSASPTMFLSLAQDE
jgi:GNAT superfamily N-acetyltransferase